MIGEMFLYSLKSGMCLIMFYLFYKLLLSRDTFHAFNRAVLLLVMVLSITVPLVRLQLPASAPTAQVRIDVEPLMATVMQPVGATQTLTLVQLLFIIYIIGVAAFIAWFVASMIRLRHLLSQGEHRQLADGIHLVLLSRDIAPFSWFRYIVMSRTDHEQHAHEILAHERAHIARHHSLDIVLSNLMIIFQWYNPASWLLKRELQEVHEYEADEAVINGGIDARSYQLLLVRKAVGEERFLLANNFNHSSLKKRIRMMKTTKSNAWNRAKLLLAAPLAAMAAVAFASETTSNVANQIVSESNDLVATVTETPSEVYQNVKTKKTAKPQKAVKKAVAYKSEKETMYDVVEEMPSFVGGTVAMMEYIGKNMKYPKEAVDKNIQGRVIVSFVVEKDGSIVEPKVMRSVDPALDAEALRVVSSMPKWNPGKQDGKPVRVKYVIPINFSQDGGKTGEPKTVKSVQTIDLSGTLVLLDGKKVSGVDVVAPDQIESIQIYKDAESVKKHGGDDNTKQVVVITSKKQK